jgi:hypothetical protein
MFVNLIEGIVICYARRWPFLTSEPFKKFWAFLVKDS